MRKILFILKKREESTEDYTYGVSTGLLHSASFVKDMLVRSDMDSKLVVVNDNNDIDREVTLYRPTHVIIEALWVVPEKFEVLRKLHPTVKWIVRIHSETPFLANEGIAMDWIFKYVDMENVYVAVNSDQFASDIKQMLWDPEKDKIIYLPNYYPTAVMTPVASRKTTRRRVWN